MYNLVDGYLIVDMHGADKLLSMRPRKPDGLAGIK